jgi:exopolysaccharide biosynthesis polyprenyl glycosylphosphotransferase
MRNKTAIALTLIMVIIDILMTNISVIIAYWLRFKSGLISFQVFHSWNAYIGLAILESILFPIVFAFRSQYRFKRGASRIDELQKVFTAVSIGTVLTWAISAFFFRDFDYSRALMAFAWGVAILLIWASHLLQYWLRALLLRRGAMESRVLIVGTGEMGRVILQKIQQSPSLGYRAAGFISPDYSSDSAQIEGVPVLGGIDDVGRLVNYYAISEVIIAEPGLPHQRIIDIVAACEKGQVNIKAFPDIFQIISSEVSIGDLNGMPMVSIRDAGLRGWNLAIKRAVDIMVAVFMLTLFSPLMLLTALLTKISSPKGPVFYIQERVGLDGRPFPMIKFRSMMPEAEEETGPVWATKSDPRATGFGAFIRRFSLDELPQFINVLLGEMSVVGPRPERPYFVEQFSKKVPRYLERHREKAGLTGWAQVNGLRGNVSIEERTAYDLWYVENWTLLLDLRIMLRTLIAIFRDTNG